MKNHICFILGAGASIPYGYPSGKSLILRIIQNFDQQIDVNRALQNKNDLCSLGIDVEDINDLVDSLRYSGVNSIDQLLENRPKLVKVGKFAIVQALLNVVQILRPKDDHWYEYIWNLMCKYNLESFNSKKYCFITFNYDLTFETYLANALTRFYGIDIDRADEMIRDINIIHIHGKLGNYPWVEDNSSYILPNNPRKEAENIYSKALGIKIIHEMNGNNSVYDDAFSILNESEKICFLGFGFHASNVERLRINDLNSDVELYASSFELTEVERNRISKMFSKKINFDSVGRKNLGYIRHNLDIY